MANYSSVLGTAFVYFNTTPPLLRRKFHVRPFHIEFTVCHCVRLPRAWAALFLATIPRC